MLKVIRFSFTKVLNSNHVRGENTIAPNLIKRHTSSYESSKPIPKPEDLPNYEVTQDENDWKYVERLLPEPYVPTVEENKIYPSGWVPQKFDANLPYVLQRTKNGMLPIYLHIGERGMKRVTMIRRVHGDMWNLAADVKNYLENISGKKIYTKIHEITGTVCVHGDHVSDVKVWALKRGL